jgi:2'-5' RNA ligase
VSRSPTARLFVAVDPPADVCGRLAEWARGALRAAPGTAHGTTHGGLAPRVLDPELLHVTLCFLGNRPVGEMDLLAAQLGVCESTVGRLSVGAPLWLPARQPRALAVELHDDGGRLANLQREVVGALLEVSGWQPNEGVSADQRDLGQRRRFHPHITVARMRRGGTPAQRALAPTPSLSFTPRELVLYRSWLSPDGAGYEAIASHRLA